MQGSPEDDEAGHTGGQLGTGALLDQDDFFHVDEIMVGSRILKQYPRGKQGEQLWRCEQLYCGYNHTAMLIQVDRNVASTLARAMDRK